MGQKKGDGVNWEKAGADVAVKARAMSSPQRVKAILEDEAKYWNLLADLASFQQVADQLKAKGQNFNEAGTYFVWSIAFISYVREKGLQMQTRKN